MPLSRALLAAVLGATLLVVGCNTSNATSPTDGANRTKIRVGYIGITCEAPIFCAFENGFFKEEGLDVQLIKCEWSKYKDVLALGGFDINASSDYVSAEAHRAGLRRKVHCGHPSRLPPGPSGNRRKYQNGKGSPRKTDWGSRHGNAAVHLC